MMLNAKIMEYFGRYQGEEPETPPEDKQEKNAQKLSQKRRVITASGIIIAVAVLLGLIHLWTAPLGTELSAVRFDTIATIAPIRDESGNIYNPQSRPTFPATPTPAHEPYCNGPDVMHILIVGNDNAHSDYDSPTGFADIIRLARVDFVNPSVTMLALPRDLWVPIPGLLEQAGTTHNRLKTAYAYGNVFIGPGGGPVLLAQTISQLFGAQIDHYMVISFNVFVEGVDIVGGVDVYLPQSFNLGNWEEDTLPQGWNHLDGEMALQFVRSRPDNGSDIQRIDRQTLLLRSLQSKLLSPQVFPAAPRLIRTMSKATLTDLSPSDISAMLCLAQRMESEALQTVSLDSSLYSIVTDRYEHDELIPDYAGITEYIWRFQSGEMSPSAP